MVKGVRGWIKSLSAICHEGGEHSHLPEFRQVMPPPHAPAHAWRNRTFQRAGEWVKPPGSDCRPVIRDVRGWMDRSDTALFRRCWRSPCRPVWPDGTTPITGAITAPARTRTARDLHGGSRPTKRPRAKSRSQPTSRMWNWSIVSANALLPWRSLPTTNGSSGWLLRRSRMRIACPAVR